MGEQHPVGTNHATRTNSLFWRATGINCLLAILIGSNIGGGGSDAAGNGMEAGYASLGALMALGAIGLLSVTFALTRVIWARYVLVALVVAFSFVLLLGLLFSL